MLTSADLDALLPWNQCDVYSIFTFSFTIQVDKVSGGERAKHLGGRAGHAERTLYQLLGLKEAL